MDKRKNLKLKNTAIYLAVILSILFLLVKIFSFSKEIIKNDIAQSLFSVKYFIQINGEVLILILIIILIIHINFFSNLSSLFKKISNESTSKEDFQSSDFYQNKESNQNVNDDKQKEEEKKREQEENFRKENERKQKEDAKNREHKRKEDEERKERQRKQKEEEERIKKEQEYRRKKEAEEESCKKREQESKRSEHERKTSSENAKSTESKIKSLFEEDIYKIIDLINKSHLFENIFKGYSEELLIKDKEMRKKFYRKLSKIIHPDLMINNKVDKEKLTSAFQKLLQLYELTLV